MFKLATAFFIVAAICTVLGFIWLGTIVQIVGFAFALIGAFLMVVLTMKGGNR